MSKTTKTIIWIVVIVAVILFVASLMGKPSMQEQNGPGQQKAQGPNGGGKNMPAMSAANDTSDEALAKDVASLDARITAIETAQAAGPANAQE